MAKLNGVKTLDMANGEVTRVEYDGAEYVKVGEFKSGTEIGNLLRCTHNYSDFTVGEFYEVYKEGVTDAVLDDCGDNPYIEISKFEVFRKAAAPSLDERVTELERKVEALEGGKPGEVTYRREQFVRITDRKPKAGDFVKFSESYVDNDVDLTVGKYYEIEDVDSDDDLVFKDDDDDVRYKEVEDGVEVYELVSAPAPLQEVTLSVGDYAKVVPHDNRNFFGGKPGDIVKIVKVHTVGGFKVEELDGGDYGHNPIAQSDALVRATDEEVAEAKAKLFNVGVYVKILSAGKYGGVDVGSIGKVVEGYGGPQELRVDKLDGSDHDYFVADQLEKVSAEEAAKIEAKQAEQARKESERIAETRRWASINRKPNEFKKGDVVRVKRVSSLALSSDLQDGEIGEVGESSEEIFRVVGRLARVNWVSKEDVELITPVEARFGRE